MRHLMVVAGVVLGVVGGVQAAELVWDRSPESDVARYRVYMCLTPGCTVEQIDGMRQPQVIGQVPVGQVPSYLLPIEIEGAAAVSAEDTSGNESGLSVAVPFDQKAPADPLNPRLR